MYYIALFPWGVTVQGAECGIEVIITSGSIDKLKTYRRLGVAEVWFWDNRLRLYHLRSETPSEFLETHGYEQIMSSEFLPELNISLLEECTLISDHVQAKREFKQRLEARSQWRVSDGVQESLEHKTGLSLKVLSYKDFIQGCSS